MSKKDLSERDICTKYITPAIEEAGWDRTTQFLEEVYFTDGKIYVRGKLTARGKAKRVINRARTQSVNFHLGTQFDGLEQSITQSQQQNEMLLQQVLREALEPKVDLVE